MIELANLDVIPQGMVNAGMPVLEQPKRVISPFEFLPAWFFYTPVVLQSAVLSMAHRDWALPLIANPAIKLSGMVGESKHGIFTSAGETANQWILPFITLFKSSNHTDDLLNESLQQLDAANLSYPLVAKPDLGCRGVGVKLIHSNQQLREYIESFPLSGRFLLQKKSPYSAEAGVFLRQTAR